MLPIFYMFLFLFIIYLFFFFFVHFLISFILIFYVNFFELFLFFFNIFSFFSNHFFPILFINITFLILNSYIYEVYILLSFHPFTHPSGVGCVIPEFPGLWVKKEGFDRLLVGCGDVVSNVSDVVAQLGYLECSEGGQWVGEMPDCSVLLGSECC